MQTAPSSSMRVLHVLCYGVLRWNFVLCICKSSDRLQDMVEVAGQSSTSGQTEGDNLSSQLHVPLIMGKCWGRQVYTTMQCTRCILWPTFMITKILEASWNRAAVYR